MTRASKILPPAIPPSFIARPRLEDLLNESLNRRLTTVVAGAGFGKSTLLAGWATRVGCGWYTFDEGDAAWERGVLDALGARLPDLPAKLFTVSGMGRGPLADERSRAEALAAHLSEALQDHLASDLALVLDDVHTLERQSPASRFIEALCRHSPDRLHVIISSRSEPPFPIERLRARGQVLAVDPGRLAFSAEEVEEFLAASLGNGASVLAGPVHEMTGGWPAAVRLVVETLHRDPDGQDSTVLDALRRPGSLVFAYLAEEVFAQESPGVRALLRRVAPFDRFTIELCEALGLAAAGRTLADLARRGLFVVPHETALGRWYTLHALVREFALSNWPLSRRELRALHRRAARWFESTGYIDEALRSHAVASEPEEIVRLLSDRGPEILATGAVESVLRLAELVPPHLRDSRVEEVVGEAHSIRGDAASALACFQRAAGSAEQLPAGLAWRIARILSRIDYGEALAVCARARLDGSGPRDEVTLMAVMASIHLMQGDLESCRSWAERALEVSTAADDPYALARAHALLMAAAIGRDPEAADAHYRSALHAAERAGDVITSIGIRGNRASQLIDEGSYEEALKELEVALPQAELAGFVTKLAHILENRGDARFYLGRLEEAISDFEASKRLYQRVTPGKACRPLAGLGKLFRQRGDLAVARGTLEEAASIAEQANDSQGLMDARRNLSLLLAVEEPERAARLAEQAVDASRSWGGQWLISALVSAGWVELAAGERERAASLAAEATHKARTGRRRPGLAEALELQALSAPKPAGEIRRLEEAVAIYRELKNPLGEARSELALARLSHNPASRALARRAERRLLTLGVRPEAAAGAAGLLASLPKESPPAVAVRTLGGFQVQREGQPVPVAEWQSKKARDLLKILLARRGRPTPRDVLMEAMWPEEDPAPVAKRLSVALAIVRAVLDPGRRFPSEHFIAGDDSALWIDLRHLPVDVEAFLAEAETGLAFQRSGRSAEALEVLAAAEASYTGDFLEEDLYESWAAPLREEARARYVAVARALSEAGSASGDPDAAVRYRLRILERDPYDEEAHLKLVSALIAAGRHGEARRSYQNYVSRMEELDVEPAPFPRKT